jgi:isopentenyldiphosphate isomerase
MDYLKEKQMIALVNEQDEIIGQVEKWEAHKKGLLHRAFTLLIFFQGKILLQHRKHPVFNNVFDATISSHQIYKTGHELQTDEEAIIDTLKREWGYTSQDLATPLTELGKIYYQAKDPYSEYLEHEVCHIWSCAVHELRLPNMEFAYGFSLKDKKDLLNAFDPLYPLLAPWVHKSIEDKLI